MAMSSMETGMCRYDRIKHIKTIEVFKNALIIHSICLTYIFSIHYRGGGTGSGGSNSGDELKTQFMTREGTYRLMTLSEYSRPNRVGYANNAQGGSGGGVPVRVSFVTVPAPEGTKHF